MTLTQKIREEKNAWKCRQCGEEMEHPIGHGCINSWKNWMLIVREENPGKEAKS